MNRRKVIAFLAVVLLALGLWWLLRSSQPEPAGQVLAEPSASASPPADAPVDSPPKSEAELRQKAVAMIEGVFNTPIEFYGRVVDQSGDPVPDAHVGIGVNDRFNASGSNYSTTSDKDGYFSFKGARGASMGVNVRKEGYYQIHKVSNQSFAYGMGPDGAHQAPPAKETPAIFVLHKMGKTEPLVYGGKRRYKPSKDGQPLDVNLETGKVVPSGQGDIRFERWAKDKEKNQRGHFDWRFRITVPGGGLVERKGQFDFEAPEGGYKESVEINMPASLGDQWSYTVNRSYFVRLRDGRYARFDAMVQAGHDSSALVVDAFLNPKPGSRNLEYDPKQTAGAP
jgi:hypothetical protein